MTRSKTIFVIAAAIVAAMTTFATSGNASQAPTAGEGAVMRIQTSTVPDHEASHVERDGDARKSGQSHDHSFDVRPDPAKDSLDTARPDFS